MQQREFEARHAAEWAQFERWVALEEGGVRLGTADYFDVAELPHRYRRLAQHLALARDRAYSLELVARLERLVMGGHQFLYGATHGSAWRAAGAFVRHGFPQLVRLHWRSVTVAHVLLLGPMVLLTILLQFFPSFAYVMVSPEQLAQVAQMYDPGNNVLGEGRNAGSDLAMWGFYVWNNVRIDFQCFAGGLLFGLGSVFFLVFNGTFIGTIAGHLTQLGYIETFWGFVAGHSALELVGAALSGAAGLQLGHALIAPGRRTRIDALKFAARDAVRILYGAATMTFLAAFVEAFWSASRVPPVEIKYAVGIFGWLIVVSYLCFAGRRRAASTHEDRHAP
jgi:uncharacterized membrane protein SpoIIM required for sporulation